MTDTGLVPEDDEQQLGERAPIAGSGRPAGSEGHPGPDVGAGGRRANRTAGWPELRPSSTLSKRIAGPALAKMFDTGALARHVAASVRPPTLELFTSGLLRELAAGESHQRRLLRQVAEGVLGSQLAALDRLTPAFLLGPELASTARLVNMLAGDSVLAGARSSAFAAHHAGDVVPGAGEQSGDDGREAVQGRVQLGARPCLACGTGTSRT